MFGKSCLNVFLSSVVFVPESSEHSWSKAFCRNGSVGNLTENRTPTHVQNTCADDVHGISGNVNLTGRSADVIPNCLSISFCHPHTRWGWLPFGTAAGHCRNKKASMRSPATSRGAPRKTKGANNGLQKHTEINTCKLETPGP